MTWTPDTPPPCPCCGTRLVERTEPDGGEEGGTLYAYLCPGCRWEDAGSYDYTRLTVATAPWTRDLWADIDRLGTRIIELETQVDSDLAMLRAFGTVSAECWTPNAEDAVVRVRSRVVGMVLRNMVQSCIEAGGANNLTISMGPNQEDSDLAGYRWEVHVVKPGGKSPTEQRREVVAERDALAARVRELEAPGECQSVHKLRAALAEVLLRFTDEWHLSEGVIRTGWVPVEQVEQWRSLLSPSWREGQGRNDEEE